MKLCRYTPADEGGCLEIFDGNTPPFFAARERESFLSYLKRVSPPCYYFVVRDDNGTIIACGGMNFEAPTRLARLRWDMVSGEFQRRGAGAFLVQSRLSLICRIPEIRTVTLGTSQYSYRFYEKMGFSTLQVVPDGIAPGLDEYLMQLQLEGKMRSTLARFGRKKAISWEAI